VQQQLAGLLAQVPFSRSWHPAGAETVFRWRKRVPARLFEQLFYTVAGPARADSPGLRWRGLLVCAVDGTLTPVPDTPANRKHFGSTGTADDSGPFPQMRAVVVSVAGDRATLGAALGTSATGEQTLTKQLVEDHPEVFAAGRVFIFDRNWPGAELVAAIRAAGGHVIARLKSDLSFPLHGKEHDGSWRSQLSTPDGPLPARLVDYQLRTPSDGHTGRDAAECYTLLTTLADPHTHSAEEVAALYPRRWSGVETLIGQNKSTITGAGPSRGPMLRSTTPEQVYQEAAQASQPCRPHSVIPASARPHPRNKTARHDQHDDPPNHAEATNT